MELDFISKRTQGDRYIWMIVLALALFSLLAVFSSTEILALRGDQNYILKHTLLLMGGLALVYVAHLINFKYYSRLSQVLFVMAIILLILTNLFGVEKNEARRWLEVPFVNLTFQTSDFAKLALVMYVARYLSINHRKMKRYREKFLPIMLWITFTCFLIAPSDLSSAVVLFVTCMFLLFIGRAKPGHVVSVVMTSVVLLFIVVALFDVGRFETWRNRVSSFVETSDGSLQSQQARMAIANGGFLGVGPGNSDQKKFLANSYSDFIYAIIVEEYGLIGGVILVLLYLALLARAMWIMRQSPEAFGAFLIIGLATSISLQAFINMAVATHLLPVTGLPLPLVSMGGTSIWFTGLAFGIILSVARNVQDLGEEPV